MNKQTKPVVNCAYCLSAAYLLTDINEEAWIGRDVNKWQKVTDSEYQSLENKTWDMVEPLAIVNIVGCKWILKIKRHTNNSIERDKARLIAHGFSLEEGIGFEEVLFLVVRYNTIRVLLSLADILDFDHH